MRKYLFWGFIVILVVCEAIGTALYKFTGFNDDLPKLFWMLPFILLGSVIVIGGLIAMFVGKSFFGSDPKGTKTVSVETKADSKDKSKDTATKTVAKETSTSSGWGHFFNSPPFKIFLVAVSILTCILVLWALNIAAPQVKKTKETLKANGLLPDGSKSSSKIDLKTKKEEDRHIETMKRLEIQADLAKRVKTSTVFGTSYTTDEEKQQANDTKKPAETQTQTDQASSTKQGKYPQQQQYVEYPNAVPLGATTLTK